MWQIFSTNETNLWTVHPCFSPLHFGILVVRDEEGLINIAQAKIPNPIPSMRLWRSRRFPCRVFFSYLMKMRVRTLKSNDIYTYIYDNWQHHVGVGWWRRVSSTHCCSLRCRPNTWWWCTDPFFLAAWIGAKQLTGLQELNFPGTGLSITRGRSPA